MLLCGTAAALGWAVGQGRPRAEPKPRPNVLFILADDLGFADLSCYGRRGLRTPNIDRLAAEGLRFTQAYANSPVCSASRTAIITGRYPDRMPVGLAEPLGSDDELRDLSLPAGKPTLPGVFKAAGYQTALFGKWHLGGGDAGPMTAGYDYFFGFHPGADDYFRRPSAKEAQDPKYPGTPLFENDKLVQPKGYLTDLLADAAVKRIEGAGAKPFFISLHFNAPHWPWEGPGDEAKSAKLKSLRDEDGGSEAVFGQMVEAMDAGIGRVLAALDRAGLARDTIVLFTSDNGGERYGDVWPLTGMKGELLEGGIRVPAILRWPDRLAAGRTVDQVCLGFDWLPTLAAAADITLDPQAPRDGENVLPVLLGAAPSHPRKVFWRYKASDQAAVRDGDWKYLKIAGREFLFNIARDERERANYLEAEPAIAKRLRNDFDAWNLAMLPYPLASTTDTPKGRYADRY